MLRAVVRDGKWDALDQVDDTPKSGEDVYVMKTQLKPKCTSCRGYGHMQPTSTGMESSWRINQFLMSHPCGRCGGTGVEPPKVKAVK